jgi:antitoxin component YwqK of YwqJK toxin-antitoxin module
MIRKRPKDGTIRRKRAFAWLPVRTDDGYRLWFEYYTRVERYCGFNDMWVLPKRLSRGSKIMTNDGDKSWFLNGKLHREDGPAVEWNDGSKFWYLNGKLHREDGPAVEYSDGTKSWYLNGQCHREDGPAVERSNGYKAWYLNGKHLTEEAFNKRMTPTVEMTMAQISEALGKNVKVVK